MAEGKSKDSQEKTEEPTPKKKKDAKDKGQVPRSKELNTTIVLLVASISLFAMGETIGVGVTDIMRNNLSLDRELIFGSNKKLIAAVGATLSDMFMLLFPYLLILLVAVLLTPGLIGGWSFSAKAMAPKMSKLSFFKGMKRMFGVKGLMELVKSVAKVALIGSVAFFFIWTHFSELMSLGTLNPGKAVVTAITLLAWLFIFLSAATLVIAAIDIPFQIVQHLKEIKMSKQEVKDESKQTEGNPEVKGRIRRLQQEMSNNRMMEEIPKADVVVTNPTHFSVALKYDDKGSGAPVVIALGVDLIALRIRKIATENEVTIFEAPPLARALYYNSELNMEIPFDLYHAVAQVLAYVYQLRTNGDDVERPNSIEIPDEYQKYR